MSSIYFASALFSAREKLLNLELVSRLESEAFGNFRVFLPQRDGFEFTGLEETLRSRIGPESLKAAVQTVIYLFDLAMLSRQSEYVVAVLDEPLDDGVLVEISYAHLLGKPVVGLRTDSRTPYGDMDEPLGGIHSFAAFQCDEFVLFPSASSADDLDRIADAIVHFTNSTDAPGVRGFGPQLEAAISRLFDGIELGVADIHDPGILNRIIRNYANGEESFLNLAPHLRLIG